MKASGKVAGKVTSFGSRVIAVSPRVESEDQVFEQRGLSYVDHPAMVDTLAQRCAQVIAGDADHLLVPATLRAMAVTALLDAGVAPQELTIDKRIVKGRAPLWVGLESGIGTCVLFAHPHPAGRLALRQLTNSLAGSLDMPAHEHLAVALLGVTEDARWWFDWPLTAGDEVSIHIGPASTMFLQCLAAAAAGTHHRLVAWEARRAVPGPAPGGAQPHLFALPSPQRPT